jgi:two-component system chemotaxis response regulator CheB
MRPGPTDRSFGAIVMGASAGAIVALKQILPWLRDPAGPAVVIVVHRPAGADSELEAALAAACPLPVRQAGANEAVASGTVYLAPPDHHLLIEDDSTFAISIEPAVNHARPSIDVTFESAADAFGRHLAAVVLTGANRDGSLGLKRIKTNGGLTVVQAPETAEVPSMPAAAIAAAGPERVLPLADIGPFLARLPAVRCGHHPAPPADRTT